MKIVVDMNMSPDWVPWLGAIGHDAVHWRDVGAPRAKDATIMAWAVGDGRVVLTNDLDFGAILAATGATGPSVLQVRTEDVLPDSCGPRIAAAIVQFRAELHAGALVTIHVHSQRASILPMRPRGRA